MAKDFGVDALNLKSLSLGSFVDFDKKVELAKQNLPDNIRYSRFIFKDGILKARSKPQICSWMRQVVILWNGDIVPCCRDPKGKYVMGNILKEDLKDIWNNERMKKFRGLINSDQKNVEH